MSDRWPECIQCGSDNTTVVPISGEWTCEDCGCQWNYDELPEGDERAEEVPDLIEGLLYELTDDLEPVLEGGSDE